MREVKDLQIVTHEEYDKNGKLKKNRYVQFTVIGKQHEWPDFMTIREFKKHNPTVIVDGLN
jgi:hypothetical protein